MTDELHIDERPVLDHPVMIAAFRGWLLAEAAADAQQLDRIRVKRASAREESPALVV